MKINKRNIGMLRQWLNEDRITDPKKMVTDKQLEFWLKDVVKIKKNKGGNMKTKHKWHSFFMGKGKCHYCGKTEEELRTKIN